MKFEAIQPGMILFDVHSHKMGNMRMRTLGVWTVRIISVDPVLRRATVSWNGNSEQTFFESKLKKLKKEKPHLVRNFCGAYRLETREEKKIRLAEEVSK